MTQEIFLATPVTARMQATFLGKQYLVLGVNWLSGTIRLKGSAENLNADFTQCEYIHKQAK